MTIRSKWAQEPFELNRAMDYSSVERFNGKPVGFWYDVDGDWERFCRAERWGIYTLRYRYELELNMDRILQVTNHEEFQKFCDRFWIGAPVEFRAFLKPARFGEEIDWFEVREQYDGIEIAPYMWKFRLNYDWYYGWDCASGCVWNLDAITSMRLIRKRHCRVA